MLGTNIHTIPINIGDFLSDIVHMDARETGAYMLLIIAHIQSGEEGLPNNHKRLARIARVSDKVWQNGLGNTLLENFTIITYTKGDQKEERLISERCLEIIQKVEERSAQNSANALKRWKHGDALAQRSKYSCNTNQNPNTKTNNSKGGSAVRAGLHTSPPLPMPREDWQKNLKEVCSESIYRAWFSQLRLENGYITSDNNFILDRCERDYRKEIENALSLASENFYGFKPSSNVQK